MNDPQTSTSAPEAAPTREDTLRKITLFDYALHLLSPFTFMTLSVIALIINYVKRPDSVGTVFHSHMNFMIRTCWWTLFWIVITWVIAFITLGIFGWVTIFPVLWYMYRMIKGLLRAVDSRPID